MPARTRKRGFCAIRVIGIEALGNGYGSNAQRLTTHGDLERFEIHRIDRSAPYEGRDLRFNLLSERTREPPF